MNVMRSVNYLKCVPTIIQGIRNYAAPKALPITWIRPEKKSCISKEVSGDQGLNFNLTSKDYALGFENIPELEDADEIVKRMFSIEFQRRKDLVQLQKQRAMDMVKRHSCDKGSMECIIASLTVEILQLQEHQENFRKNVKSKVFLKELIERRKKLLKKVRIQDYRRFEFLLERLNLVYHPIPEENPYLQVKANTRRLLNKYCDELVEKKLKDYQKELESHQKDFFREKVEKLEFMRNEEIACGITPTISEEEIEMAKQKAATFE